MLPSAVLIRTWYARTNPSSARFTAEKKRLAEEHRAKKRKMLKDFEEEKEKLLGEHAEELEEKAKQVYEARQFAQEADKKLRSAEGSHNRAKQSLELTATHAQRLESEAEDWKKFLKDMDGQLSRKSDFPSVVVLWPSHGVWPDLQGLPRGRTNSRGVEGENEVANEEQETRRKHTHTLEIDGRLLAPVTNRSNSTTGEARLGESPSP